MPLFSDSPSISAVLFLLFCRFDDNDINYSTKTPLSLLLSVIPNKNTQKVHEDMRYSQLRIRLMSSSSQWFIP